MGKIIKITESELKRLIESKIQLSENKKFNQNKFETFLNQFPDNATSWSEATEELIELYDMLLSYHNDIYGDNPSMQIPDKNTSRSKTPAEFNKKFKKLIRDVIAQTTDEVKDYVYDHYSNWFENLNEDYVNGDTVSDLINQYEQLLRRWKISTGTNMKEIVSDMETIANEYKKLTGKDIDDVFNIDAESLNEANNINFHEIVSKKDKEWSDSGMVADMNDMYSELVNEYGVTYGDEIKKAIESFYESNIYENINQTELEPKYQIGNKFLWIDERKEYSIEDIEMKGNTFYYLLSDSTHYISEPSLDELIEMDEVEFLG